MTEAGEIGVMILAVSFILWAVIIDHDGGKS
jgi:hypothetical protein